MATLTLRSALSRPLKNTEVDGNFTALNDELALKAPIDAPVFTTSAQLNAPVLTALSYTNPSDITTDPTLPVGDKNLITTEYLQSALQSTATNILPAQDAYDTGTVDSDGNKIYKGLNLGSSAKRFANIFVRSASLDADTLKLGTASLKGSAEGGVVLPTNTAIGEASNVIPPNIASSVLDSAFAAAGFGATLQASFLYKGLTASGAGIQAVGLEDDGSILPISSAGTTTDRFVGFVIDTLTKNQSITVTLSGVLSGFSGLIVGTEYFLEPTGALSTASTATNIKIGRAVTISSLFIYSTSTLDTYVQSVKKIELTNLSIATNATPSGEGSIAYDNTTGVFTFTPTKSILNAELTGQPTTPTAATGNSTLRIANTEFVQQEIAALVDSAPATLDTLQEIAVAINNEGNFATTVARLSSPTFTGLPQAPTPGSASNDTSLASTAFVQNAVSSLATFNDPTFTGSVIAPTPADTNDSTLVATTAFVQTAIAQAGIGSLNIDGGVAQTVRNNATLVLDGGGA